MGLRAAADDPARAVGQPVRPLGDRHGSGLAWVALGAGLFVVKVLALAGMLAAGEVFAAKLRLFRVPELLAGSFALALLAVLASYVLACKEGGRRHV